MVPADMDSVIEKHKQRIKIAFFHLLTTSPPFSFIEEKAAAYQNAAAKQRLC